jgi:uncharacterized membrane protein YebE (DUF533 family)
MNKTLVYGLGLLGIAAIAFTAYRNKQKPKVVTAKQPEGEFPTKNLQVAAIHADKTKALRFDVLQGFKTVM